MLSNQAKAITLLTPEDEGQSSKRKRDPEEHQPSQDTDHEEYFETIPNAPRKLFEDEDNSSKPSQAKKLKNISRPLFEPYLSDEDIIELFEKDPLGGAVNTVVTYPESKAVIQYFIENHYKDTSDIDLIRSHPHLKTNAYLAFEQNFQEVMLEKGMLGEILETYSF